MKTPFDNYFDDNITYDETFEPSPDSDVLKVGMVKLPTGDLIECCVLKDGSRIIIAESLLNLFALKDQKNMELIEKHHPELAEILNNPKIIKL